MKRERERKSKVVFVFCFATIQFSLLPFLHKTLAKTTGSFLWWLHATWWPLPPESNTLFWNDLLQIDLVLFYKYGKVDSWMGGSASTEYVMVTFLLFFGPAAYRRGYEARAEREEPISCVHTPSINKCIRAWATFSLSLSYYTYFFSLSLSLARSE